MLKHYLILMYYITGSHDNGVNIVRVMIYISPGNINKETKVKKGLEKNQKIRLQPLYKRPSDPSSNNLYTQPLNQSNNQPPNHQYTKVINRPTTETPQKLQNLFKLSLYCQWCLHKWSGPGNCTATCQCLNLSWARIVPHQ